MSQYDALLERLDRVGVHSSVAARYCKEAAAAVRELSEKLDTTTRGANSLGRQRDSAEQRARELEALLREARDEWYRHTGYTPLKERIDAALADTRPDAGREP